MRYQRKRTSTFECTPAYTDRVVDTASGVTTSDVSSAYPATLGKRQMVDVVDTRFYEKSKRGSIVTSPMSSTCDEYSDMTTSALSWVIAKKTAPTKVYTTNESNLNAYVSRGAWDSPPVILPDFGKVRQRVINDAFAELKGSAAQTLVDLGEIHETLEMLRSPLKGLRHMLSRSPLHLTRRQLRQKEWKQRCYKADNYADDATSAWLEYRVGWIPLIGSIQGHIEALSKQLNSTRRVTGRAFAVIQGDAYIETVSQPPWNTIGATGPLEHIGSRHHKQVELRAGAVGDVKLTLSQLLQLDAEKLPSTIWELIPCSWVADRFLHIGGQLTALMPDPEVSVKGSWLVERTVSEMRFTHEIKPSGPFQPTATYNSMFMSGGANGITRTVTSKTRTVGVAPHINIEFDLSSVGHLTHLLDYASLAYQRIGKALLKKSRR